MNWSSTASVLSVHDKDVNCYHGIVVDSFESPLISFLHLPRLMIVAALSAKRVCALMCNSW